MDVWDDTFGEGSRFQRVFFLGPIIRTGILSVLGGVALAGPAGLVLGPVFGLMGLAIGYVVATLPCAVAWFIAFRLARLAGAARRSAALIAAPILALVASLALIAAADLGFDGMESHLAQGHWEELLPVTLAVATLSMIIATVLAGTQSGSEGFSRRRGLLDFSDREAWK